MTARDHQHHAPVLATADSSAKAKHAVASADDSNGTAVALYAQSHANSAPEPPQRLKVREHIADTWPELQATVRKRAFRERLGDLGGDKLTRVPRGFPSSHPAAEYLKHCRFVAGREFPAGFPYDDRFYPTLVETFKTLMPLLRFLNEPLLEEGQS